jgi:hypothetical protein
MAEIPRSAVQMDLQQESALEFKDENVIVLLGADRWTSLSSTTTI